MSEQKKSTVTSDQIARFLEQTGFVFEMRANEFFVKVAGYNSEINSTFFDLDGRKEREIDIVASTILNEINVHFVIECKQSAVDKWIFICNARASRFYYAIKHLPNLPVEFLKDRRLFSSLHTFDRKIPLAGNYTCYSIATGKKSDQCKIEDCVHKLPKALIDLASRVREGRHLFFPVALFAGQIFAVSYSGALEVEERPFLQHHVWFESEAYRRAALEDAPFRISTFGDMEEAAKVAKEKAIRDTARRLGGHYQLDFVTETGLPEYIKMVEREVSAVQIKDWPMPERPQPVTK